MTDVLTPDQRRLNMSCIRGRDTKPELLVRKALHARGFRFRLHRKDLPGCPDIVLPRFRVATFVHGCFWHGHNCPLFKVPATRTDFWQSKIARNIERDRSVQAALIRDNWRVLVIWECALKGPGRHPISAVIEESVQWIRGDKMTHVVRGKCTKKSLA